MMTAPLPSTKVSREVVRGVVVRFVQLGVQLVIITVILFATAGSLRWVNGWLYLGVALAALVLMGAWVLPRNPEVVAERAKLHKDTKGFDKVMVLMMTLTTFAVFLVAGLDARQGWSPLGWGWWVLGGVLYLLSMVPTAAAMVANARLATTVRVESSGHALATGGPYRWVRHPFYAGLLLQYPALALLLGSAWALVPAAAAIGVLVVRTWLEDRTLRRDLPGYEAYALRTRFRLIPHVW
ncbi:MAG: isoprenylcysteine carboxylmethyltransferase family protein [Myxococcaceae bacterium]|nr:isoprenylcysteine carboxylmethyltransferase family protein [Myxococcaceae bacterium]